MKKSIVLYVVFLAAITLLSAGCSEEDLNSMRITVDKDGSGTIVFLSTRVLDNAGALVDNTVRGMDWGDKGIILTARKATFKKAEHLDFAGIKVELKKKSFRMTVPLGPDAVWPNILAPEQKGADGVRKSAREAGFKVSKNPTRSFKFVVKVPGKVLATGSHPKLSGGGNLLGGGQAEDTADLVLPVGKVLGSKEKTLLWEVTWK